MKSKVLLPFLILILLFNVINVKANEFNVTSEDVNFELKVGYSLEYNVSERRYSWGSLASDLGNITIYYTVLVSIVLVTDSNITVEVIKKLNDVETVFIFSNYNQSFLELYDFRNVFNLELQNTIKNNLSQFWFKSINITEKNIDMYQENNYVCHSCGWTTITNNESLRYDKEGGWLISSYYIETIKGVWNEDLSIYYPGFSFYELNYSLIKWQNELKETESMSFLNFEILFSFLFVILIVRKFGHK